MARKPKKELPPEQGRLFTPNVNAPVYEDGAAVDVKKRAESLMKAATALGQVAKYDALPKAMELAHRRRSLQNRYNTDDEPNVLEEEVLPGAAVNRTELSREAREAFDDAYGDLEAAKRAAWAQLSPDQRAELELDMEDQDVDWVSFKDEMTETKKSEIRQDGQPRKGRRKNFPTEGEIAREKLKSQMRRTLKRFEEPSSDQKAA